MVKFYLLKFGPRVSSSISGHGQSLSVGILDNRVMAANCSSNFGKQVPTVVIDLAPRTHQEHQRALPMQ